MVEQWLRHQVEEVSSLSFFLGELYEQRLKADGYYVLDI